MFAAQFNFWIAILLIMGGLYIVMTRRNFIKKIIGLNVFQTAVFILYITLSKVAGGTAPILADGIQTYSNPLPHVLILTAIVVGVATTAVGLALVVRIYEAYGTMEEDEIVDLDNEQQAAISSEYTPRRSGEDC